MAKDFSKNPALAFISQSIAEDKPAEAEAPAGTQEQAKDIPANLHLLNELKSKRLNLVLQPTIYELAQNKAKATGTSLNNFIINAIIDALEDN